MGPWALGQDPISLTLRPISECVIALREAGETNTIYAIRTQKGIVVIDAGLSCETMREIRKRVAAHFKTERFAYLILTHEHTDHYLGDRAFQDVPIISHTNAPALMRSDLNEAGVKGFQARLHAFIAGQRAKLDALPKDSPESVRVRSSLASGERELRGFSPEQLAIPANLTFTDRLSLDMGDLTLNLIFFGRAQSQSDIFIHVPEERMLFTGDVFFDRVWLPFLTREKVLDVPRGIQVLHELLDGDRPPHLVLPAHGEDAWDRGKLALWRDYIVKAWEGAKRARQEGLGLDAFLAGFPLDPSITYVTRQGISEQKLQDFHRTTLTRYWKQVELGAEALPGTR
jgi:glyoxylase-like metal-dependent hydrolase (beta-lactamase superfamily II)